MLKKDIPYKDFDGNDAVETAYFNLSKLELAQLELNTGENGLSDLLTKIVAANDRSAILSTFEVIIGKAYGVRSDDGRRFIKGPELFKEFQQTLAYDALVMELASDAVAGADFVLGVVPTDLAGTDEIQEMRAELVGDTPSKIETVQLPPTLNDNLEQPMPTVIDETPWITEDRNPTKAELRKMNRDQLREAMAAREQRKARLDQESAETREAEELRAQFDIE